jgi:hypothetical protein
MAEKENRVRGYIVLCAIAYLRKIAGEQRAKEIMDGFSAETKQTIAAAKEATWCSLKAMSEVHRAVASLGNGDEAAAKTHLIECGKYTAREASNTFLRLLMKLLTPVMFAKKLPDFWGRDCTVGKMVVEVSEDRLRNRILGIGDWEHVACLAAGFATFALETMGKTITKTEITGWSLAAPGSADCGFDVFWKT